MPIVSRFLVCMWMRSQIILLTGIVIEGHVLISDSPEGMQHHLNGLHRFAEDSGLSINLGKTKVMVFNTTP